MFVLAEVVCEFLLLVYTIDLADFVQFYHVDIEFMALLLLELGF